MEMQQWEKERSGNIGFAVQHFLELEKLLLYLAGSDYWKESSGKVGLYGCTLIIHEEEVQIIQIEVKRWGKEGSGNNLVLPFNIWKLEKLFLSLGGSDNDERRVPAGFTVILLWFCPVVVCSWFMKSECKWWKWKCNDGKRRDPATWFCRLTYKSWKRFLFLSKCNEDDDEEKNEDI